MTTDKKPVPAAAHFDAAQIPPRLASGFGSQVDVVTIETDREGRVTAWSSGAQAVLGWSAQEILGSSADCMFTPQDLANYRAANEMQCAVDAGRADDVRWHVRKNGALFWGHSEMSMLKDGAGAHVGYVKRVRAITPDREARPRPLTNNLVNPARSTGAAVFVADWAVPQSLAFWVASIVFETAVEPPSG